MPRTSDSLDAAGHRERLRSRLLEAGPEALNDQDLLEIVLFALPRRDTKPIAKRLLDHFKTFSAVIAAPVAELDRIEGLGTTGIAALKTVQAGAVRLARAEVMNRAVLDKWDRLMEYLHAELAHEKTEQFRVLFLDARNHLLADEEQSRGTVNHTPVYPREVARRALELAASAVILVHNHPSGDPTPSREDVAMTTEIATALSTLSVVLHDHVIMGKGRWTSLRREGLF
ncbi:MAG: DNA repair protein RadC [Rhodospirillales bacterium]|nr:DNA repair protein RadC [Rhodospirillales bacterium]